MILDEERIELVERLDRVRELMKNKDKELIESQSEVANSEERILITE